MINKLYINLLRSSNSNKTPPFVVNFSNILTINENLLVKKEGNLLFLSEDYGENYNKSIDVSVIGDIRTIHVFRNKRMMICGRKKIYYIDEDWINLNESTILDINGNAWVASLNNDNFMSLHGILEQKVNNKDIVVWGNYNNDQNKNQDINAVAECFYSNDYGQTVKVFFKSASSTAIGWSGVLYCRHIHHISQNPNDESFWIQTGDEPGPTMSHWIKAIYNDMNDSWVLEHIGSGDNYKTTNLFFYEDYIYYALDIGSGGLCRVKVNEASNPNKHEQVINVGTDLGGIILGKSGQVALIPTKYFNSSYIGRKITYSSDMINWHTIYGDIPEGSTSDTIYGRLFQPNSKGQVLASIQPFYNQPMYQYTFLPSIWINDILEKNGFPDAFK